MAEIKSGLLKLAAALVGVAASGTATAQYHEATENGVVSIAGTRGFGLQSRDSSFTFKPYLMSQTRGVYNWYDDEGLDKAYNQDNVANSGFAVPYAVLGFTGRAFGRVKYNLCINAAGSGGEVLNQAWIDVCLAQKKERDMGLRIGKFKTPFANAVLTTLGETMFPTLPISLTSAVILPYSLNAVSPSMGMGFDVGVMWHGMWGRKERRKWGYEVGVFNGTGGSVNGATKTVSDDLHVPSLLYAGRISVQPWGLMASSQGSPSNLSDRKMLFAVSGSVNVESENESTNDARLGAEFALQAGRLNVTAECYYMRVSFTKRQKIEETYGFLGWYGQAGYFVSRTVQIAARYDFYDRNGTGKDGLLNMPSVGVNWFVQPCGLKVQAMYQYVGRTRHETQLDRDQDNLGLATHGAVVQVGYSF